MHRCATLAILAAAGFGGSSCTSHDFADVPPEVVLSYQPPTWFEDGPSYYEPSADGRTVSLGPPFGRVAFDLETGEPTAWAPAEPVGPPGTWARRSPDGSTVAYYVPGGIAASGSSVFMGPADAAVEHDLGAPVTGLAWLPDGSAVLATTVRDDGVSELHRVEADGSRVELVRTGLDGLAFFNDFAVSPDGRAAYLPLVGVDPPDAGARHDPHARRDTDLYRIDLRSGRLSPVVVEPGDDFAPRLVGGSLYWTHNEYRDVVAIVPIDGGDAREIAGDAQLPYWSPDGRQIAFTVGGWRLADWGLNLDAYSIDVDDVGDRRSEPYPIVVGYHEDFTPAWSPDGRWLAFHSHRSAEPVTSYGAEGGADDIWLRRVGAPMSSEIRLTDFGWEVGPADWDRTGTRLVFDSWDRGGTPGVAHLWIVTIDPESGQALSTDRVPLPDGFGAVMLAAWSPVSDDLAVVERTDRGHQALWTVRPDGSRARRLVGFEAETYGGIDWKPDGRTLVYGALAEGRMQLFAYSLGTSETTQLTSSTDDILLPQVSPDGMWIAASKLRQAKELRRLPLR